jgi:hypothetical protein
MRRDWMDSFKQTLTMNVAMIQSFLSCINPVEGARRENVEFINNSGWLLRPPDDT